MQILKHNNNSLIAVYLLFNLIFHNIVAEDNGGRSAIFLIHFLFILSIQKRYAGWKGGYEMTDTCSLLGRACETEDSVTGRSERLRVGDVLK